MKIALRRSEALVPMRWGVGPFRRLRRGRLTRVTTLCRSRGKNSFLIASERTVGIATHRLPHGVHCRICTSITPGRLTVTPTGEKRHSDERPCAGRFRSVQFDCGADEFLQRRLIDLVVFVNIDGVPCISVRHHRLASTKSSTARSLSLKRSIDIRHRRSLDCRRFDTLSWTARCLSVRRTRKPLSWKRICSRAGRPPHMAKTSL